VKTTLSLGIATLLLPALLPFAAVGADFYVAPDGKDANPGTAAAPFATVARARDTVRQKVAAGLDHNVVVQIHGGVYPQTETLVFGLEDSGTEKHSITYAAAPGEKVVLSGGRTITGWKKGNGQVWTTEIPEVKAGKWYFRQFFVGGCRAIRARTPNAGEWWVTKDAGKNSDANNATVTLGVDHPIRAWKNVGDVEVNWLINNDGTRKRLGSVNEANNTFTLPPPHRWPHGMSGEYNISFPRGGLQCYFENALEMLDQPGEWYLDRQTGVLSYWPRPGEDLTKVEVVAPVLQNTLLSLQGTPERHVRNVHFRGIRVAHVDWPLPPWGFTGMFGCLQLREEDGAKKYYYWIDAAVNLKYARGCGFVDGAVECAGAIGLAMLNGCAENIIEGNDIRELGGGGMVMGTIRNRDTWRWADPMQAGEHKGYRIANNHVHDCGHDYFGSVGIFSGMTQDSVFAHNLIHDIAYTGIVISGNEAPPTLMVAQNNLVEYNHIYNVMKATVDGSAIYLSFPQLGWGAVIRGNLMHDTGKGWGGLYLDPVGMRQGCAGYRFQDNLVYHAPYPHFEGGGFIAGDNPSVDGFNPWTDNILVKGDAPSPELVEAFQTLAGLEPPYRRALLGVETPQLQLHRLMEANRADEVWSTQQFHWPAKNAGLVLAFRRTGCAESTKTVRLRGLNPDGRYEVTGVGQKTPQTITGKTLMEQGLTVEIAQKPTDPMVPNFAVLKYRQQ
jgi:hypothetical protein